MIGRDGALLAGTAGGGTLATREGAGAAAGGSTGGGVGAGMNSCGGAGRLVLLSESKNRRAGDLLADWAEIVVGARMPIPTAKTAAPAITSESSGFDSSQTDRRPVHRQRPNPKSMVRNLVGSLGNSTNGFVTATCERVGCEGYRPDELPERVSGAVPPECSGRPPVIPRLRVLPGAQKLNPEAGRHW